MSKLNKRNNGDGCIIKRGRIYYFRFRDSMTGKMTSRALSLNGRKCTMMEEQMVRAMRRLLE